MKRPQTLSAYLTRLIWWSVFPLMLFAAWLAYSHVLTLQAEIDRQASVIARNFATAIDHNLNARIGSLKVMAASPLVDDHKLWPLYYQVSQGYRANFGSHVVFAEAHEPRRMLFNTRAPFGAPLPPLPKPQGNAAAPQAVATGLPAVGDIFMGPVAREKLVAIAVPVRRADKVVYLLLATFEPRLFQERLEQVALPAGWGLSLLDSQGEVIARNRSSGKESNPADASYRRVVANLNVAPWTVVLEIPREIYMAPILAAGMALGIGSLAAILIGIGGGLWGTRRLGRAVASLTETGVSPNAPDIAEINTVRARIQSDSRRIASFAMAQDAAIEQERRRVAREVHDQMGQVFTAIRLIVQSIPKAAYPENQEAALQQALDMGIASARKITAELRPPLLDDLGLAAALDHFANETAHSGKVTCAVAVRDDADLSNAQALGLYRIVQEAVTNILRHAHAHHIDIAGERQGGRYRLRIEDDGRGFDPAGVREGAMGLTIMRERTRLMRGECDIVPRPEGGTRIEVFLPLDKSSENSDHEIPAA